MIRSILNGRQKVGSREGEWWGIMPPNFRDLLELPEKDMCAAQVYYIDQQIEQDLMLFPNENIKTIHYQDFRNQSVDSLARWIGVDKRPDGFLPEFKKDNCSDLESSELKELNVLAQKYQFRKEIFI